MVEMRYNTRVNHIKSDGLFQQPRHPFSTYVRGIDTMTHSTRVSYFPENLQDHAPWVAKHGLVAPYGECQCGCGRKTNIASMVSAERGNIVGHPRRFATGHHTFRDRPLIDPASFDADSPVRLIALTRNMVAVVDANDYEWLSQWVWSASKRRHTYYATRNAYDENEEHIIVMMHQVISGRYADHINGNGLDNRRANLRCATARQNSHNRRGNVVSISGYKGVYPQSSGGKWTAKIKTNDITYYLGTFPTKEEAARSYDKKAQELFGEFAWLNFK
jgi:hypothetical protein